MAIIGISGKKGHGKDTVAKIIQCLYFLREGNKANLTVKDLLQDYNLDLNLTGFKKKMFAEKVKQIVCLLIGCTMEQLEDPHFKEKELGEEWDKWYLHNITYGLWSKPFGSKEEAEAELDKIDKYAKNEVRQIWFNPRDNEPFAINSNIKVEILSRPITPRLLLQLIGTECGRKIIHPNIWVNALMSEYQPFYRSKRSAIRGLDGNWYDGNKQVAFPEIHEEHGAKYPNWIITDVRFPNEVKAIKDRGGIVIRIERPEIGWTGDHESETALDGYTDFNYHIVNGPVGDSMGRLIETTKIILQSEKII